MPPRSVAYDLISIGDATVDVFLQLHEATVQCTLDRRACLLCLRYAEKIPVASVHRVAAAGNAANNAVGSARLGLRVALATILGDDENGHGIARALRQSGVAASYVSFDRQHATNYHTVLNYKGERTILVFHEPRTYQLPKLARTSWTYLTSMGAGWERIARPLLQHVKRTGALLAFNPGTHQLRSARTVLRPILTHTDALLVNREEADHLLKTKAATHPRTLLQKLVSLGPQTVVVTDGPHGSYALHARDAWFMPPFPMRAVERTGAGDAFSTGFLAALVQGTSIAEALRWGTANAGSVIQMIGPQAGLLTRPGMRRLLRAYPKLVARPL